MYNSIYNINNCIQKYENCVPNIYINYLKNNRETILNTCHNILNKYIISKKISKNMDDVVITYYKKIPVKYWHSLYIIYDDLLELKKLDLYPSKNIIINFYINLIPTMIEINIVKKKVNFNFFEKIYYNNFYNMSNN